MIKAVLFLSGAALALAGCSRSEPGAPATSGASSDVTVSEAPSTPSPVANGAASPASSPLPTPISSPPPAPPLAPPLPPRLTPEVEKGEPGARTVLQTWAHALESRQFGLAWEQFGDQPPASRSAYAKWWQRYRTIKVTLGKGEGDAAMGSLYYTAPATLTGTTVGGQPFRLQGDVVVRRVNDVDGATPAQLRWHIGSADLKDVGT